MPGLEPSTITVSIAFVRSAVQNLGAEHRVAVLQASGIDPAQLALADARVPAASFAKLWTGVAQALDDEFFGLDARRMKVGSFAMVCHALAGERLLGSALKAMLRYFALFLEDVGAQLRVGGGRAGLVLTNRIAPDRPDARRFADETLLVMLHGVLCWLAGRRVLLTRLDLAYARPGHAEEYRRMFAPVTRFDAPATAMWFDARLLQAEVGVDAASLRAFLRDAPQSIFLKQVVGAALSDRVRRACRRRIVEQGLAPTLARLAADLALSPATLRRRLEAEGTTWQQLKDAVRQELALHYLADAAVTVDEVAARLGFNDPSTFYRAFRKWTGQAPGAWRRQLKPVPGATAAQGLADASPAG